MCIRAITIVLAFVSLLSLQIWTSNALKCRTDDGPSDEDMKRIARSCMRKISENEGYGNGYSSRATNNNKNNNNNYSQQNWDNNNFGGNGNNKNHEQGNDYDYNNDGFGNVYNNNPNDQGRPQQRYRGQMKTRQDGQIEQFSLADHKRDEQNERRYGSSNYGGNNRNHNQNQRNGNQHKNNSSGNNNDGSRYSGGGYNQKQDSSCVIHCFFQELNVLNNNDFPDKHKVLHVLTKDIRDRELREFYSDTIQECFHLLEIERRRDKCEFSKSLINCIGEYAKANCDDWQDHTLIFN